METYHFAKGLRLKKIHRYRRLPLARFAKYPEPHHFHEPIKQTLQPCGPCAETTTSTADTTATKPTQRRHLRPAGPGGPSGWKSHRCPSWPEATGNTSLSWCRSGCPTHYVPGQPKPCWVTCTWNHLGTTGNHREPWGSTPTGWSLFGSENWRITTALPHYHTLPISDSSAISKPSKTDGLASPSPGSLWS